jgi:hypothetical protein
MRSVTRYSLILGLLFALALICSYLGIGAQIGSVVIVFFLAGWFIISQFRYSAHTPKGPRWFFRTVSILLTSVLTVIYVLVLTILP